MHNRRSAGFTLIEIMVVVAIVAILAAIALPSFAGQMRKSRRAEAVSAMQDAQLRLERWRVDNPSFAGSGVTIQNSSHYTFAVAANAGTPNTYTITGTPQGAQTKDVCGTLTITNTNAVISKTPADGSCW